MVAPVRNKTLPYISVFAKIMPVGNRDRMNGKRVGWRKWAWPGGAEKFQWSTFSLKPTDLTEAITRRSPVGSSLRRKLPICTSTTLV
jgi:hypothetical protein